jgi:hypothetical protein
MKYLCLVHMAADAFAGFDAKASQELDRASLGYDRSLAEAGHLVAAAALQAADTAVLVRVRETGVSTTDGPFTETKEQLGGFILIEARDLNEAVRLASGIPIARYSTIEVRPIYEIPVPPALS